MKVVAPAVRPEIEQAGVEIVRRAIEPRDLDGAWLIRDDPCCGARYEDGILHTDETVRTAEGGAGMQWAV